MKKIFTSVLIFLLIVLSFKCIYATSGHYKVSINKVTDKAIPGEEFKINVAISDFADVGEGINAVTGKISYNSKILEVKSVESSSGWDSFNSRSLKTDYQPTNAERAQWTNLTADDKVIIGVGLYIAHIYDTNQILVAGVIEDSPANKVGIEVGDIVKKIDDVDYLGEQLTQASNRMKGKEGEQVKVTVDRNGKEIDFNIIREKIKFTYVKSKKLENEIGYIRITSFEGECAKEFKNEYKKLQSQGIKSLIIDLRNNGGGLVDQSLDIAEMIVPKDSKMLIAKNKNQEEEITVSKKEPIVNVPIVILVNGYTASASEILTAAIKENTNAKVVGTQTYGKGVIQGIYLFNDNKTGIKITMQEYFTPNHNKLNKIGITPDEIVELPEEAKGNVLVLDKENDNQLMKAIEILK